MLGPPSVSGPEIVYMRSPGADRKRDGDHLRGLDGSERLLVISGYRRRPGARGGCPLACERIRSRPWPHLGACEEMNGRPGKRLRASQPTAIGSRDLSQTTLCGYRRCLGRPDRRLRVPHRIVTASASRSGPIVLSRQYAMRALLLTSGRLPIHGDRTRWPDNLTLILQPGRVGSLR